MIGVNVIGALPRAHGAKDRLHSAQTSTRILFRPHRLMVQPGRHRLGRIGMGLVGPGFVAAHHVDAVRRLGNVDIVAIAGSSTLSAQHKAREWQVDRAYGDFQKLIDDPDIHVVHNTTPNHLHFDVSMAALRARKHVISDKPLAMNSEQSLKLFDAAIKAGVAHVVTFNYRGNPLVQHARAMVARGELGKPSFVHGQYFQDWMSGENVYSWRMEPGKGGESSALGDIGSHWCDLAEHVSGLRINAVLADLSTVIATRFRPAGKSRKRFSMSGEDVASVLLRFDNGAKGTFSVGQVLPGHKNDLRLEINGRAASLAWAQERQNELWVGRYAQPSSIVPKDPALMSGDALRYTQLPVGHQEGWADAFRNVIADAYQWISSGGAPAQKPDAVASFADGYRSNCLVEAMLKSHELGGVWQPVASMQVKKKGRR